MAKIFISGDLLNTVTTENFFSPNLISTIKKSDYAIVNFEAPIETNAEPIKKVGPHKHQNKETIQILKEVGFDLLLLANNHMFDYGIEGLRSTLEECEKYSLKTIGANLSIDTAYQPIIHEIGGIKFGFINASEAQFGVLDSHEDKAGYAWINHTKINEIIIELKEKRSVDYIVFFAHAGLEHYDIPLIEWRDRYKELCDLGVDCIIGSHPHIPQGYEQYGDKMIFYSLGNFYFPKEENIDRTEHGYSLLIDFNKETQISFEIIYHTVKGGVITQVDPNKSTINFDVLNSKLETDSYNNLIGSMYKDAYEKICYPYYASVFKTISKNDGLFVIIKKIVKQFFFKSRNYEKRELLLLHLTRNETYKYITKKAIQNKFNL